MKPGEHLGPYELLAPIGAGGMGEVWKARDTRLDRIVAVKFSKEQFSARFEREARVIAQLNHPHICTLHDVGPNYLVMEYVEGQPIKGPLVGAKLLEAAGQICEALDAAHRKGITHRDLKPANILATRQGIKLLDFGLAKMPAEEFVQPPGDETITEALTGRGVILGTPQYMAPEQIEGKAADARTDIFALGCVLYELATGNRAFEGPTASSVAAAILAKDPDPFQAPPIIERVIRTCLAKDPEARYQNARDVKLALDLAAVTQQTVPAGRRTWLWIAAALAALAMVVLAVFRWTTPLDAINTTRFEMEAPATTVLGNGSQVSVSPDGRNIVFRTGESSRQSQLWIRSLSGLEPKALTGATGANYPFWSPDGKWIAFSANGRLQKVSISGGPPQSISDTPVSGGNGSWHGNGKIIFVSSGRIYCLAAEGGPAVPLQKGIEERPAQPRFLPDGNRFLYRVSSGPQAGIYAAAIDGSVAKKLFNEGVIFDYDHGYLFMSSSGIIRGRAFDPGRLEFIGEPFNVSSLPAGEAFSGRLSAAGFTLAFFHEENRRELRMVDRNGVQLASFPSADGGAYSHVEISAEGKRIFADHMASSQSPVETWGIDTERRVASRLTFNGAGIPVPSPDGAFAYVRREGESPGIYKISATGGDKSELIWPGSSHHMAISRDGRFLAFEMGERAVNSDIYLLNLEGGRQATPLLQTSFSEADPQFSPDGKWLSYTSNETGQSEVYVRSLPPGSAKWQVSSKGGSISRWRGDGRELYFRSRDQVMAVSVTPEGNNLVFGAPKALFAFELSGAQGDRFAVTADGQRFVINPRVAGSKSSIVVISNWRPNSAPEVRIQE